MNGCCVRIVFIFLSSPPSLILCWAFHCFGTGRCQLQWSIVIWVILLALFHTGTTLAIDSHYFHDIPRFIKLNITET